MKHLAELLELPASDRLLLVEAIWESLVKAPEAVPVSDESRKELERRLDAYRADRSSARPWDEVEAELF